MDGRRSRALLEQVGERTQDGYWILVKDTLADVFDVSDADARVAAYRDSVEHLGPNAALLQLHDEPLHVAADLAGQGGRLLTETEERAYARLVAQNRPDA